MGIDLPSIYVCTHNNNTDDDGDGSGDDDDDDDDDYNDDVDDGGLFRFGRHTEHSRRVVIAGS